MSNVNRAPYTRPVRTVQWEGDGSKMPFALPYLAVNRANTCTNVMKMTAVIIFMLIAAKCLERQKSY